MQTLKLKFSRPFKAAGEKCAREALARSDFDPASLFRWGNMMALSVLAMLKATEREFGAAGQKAMINALVEVGREIGRQILDGVQIPPGTEPIEIISAYASWINREIYASPEDPRIEDGDRCSFDILWCPHQDSYRAFDCRVQRYLVQGMIEAMREKFPQADFQVRFTQTIPAGAKTCKFQINRKKTDEKDEWETYSLMLAQKALEKTTKTK